MTIQIRPFVPDTDWDTVWESILQPIFRAGETYPYPRDVSKEQAYDIWVGTLPSKQVFVAQEEALSDKEGGATTVLGTFYIKPNQPGQGSHICNCGYAVAPCARGKGVATQMCQASQELARQTLGYRAMQFNLVVASNTGAYRLWQKLGYTTIGQIPQAFAHPTKGYVDAYIMYKDLLAAADATKS